MTHVPPSGTPDRPWIIGEMPGQDEQRVGYPFAGAAGQELWAALARHTGLDRSAFHVRNLIPYGLPKNRPPKPAEIAAELPGLLDAIVTHRPSLIVTAGGHSTRALLNRPLSLVHGIPHAVTIAGLTTVVFPLYHPAALLHNKGFAPAFHYDTHRLGAYLRGDLPCWQAGRRPASRSWLQRPLSRPAGPLVAADVEGWTARPWGLSFTDDGDHGYVIKANDLRMLAWFRQWIAGRRLVFHNGLYDRPVMAAMGITYDTWDDTQLLAFHDQMQTGSGVLEQESQNLGVLAYRECGLVLGELSDLPGVDLDAQIIPVSDAVMQYAVDDVIAPYRLYRVYAARGYVTDPVYQIDCDALPYVRDMMDAGMPFDADGATAFLDELTEQQDLLLRDLRSLARKRGNADFNPNSHLQVRALLLNHNVRTRKRTKGGLMSTSEKALADHADHPLVASIQQYRELTKLCGTYLKPLLEALSDAAPSE